MDNTCYTHPAFTPTPMDEDGEPMRIGGVDHRGIPVCLAWDQDPRIYQYVITPDSRLVPAEDREKEAGYLLHYTSGTSKAAWKWTEPPTVDSAGHEQWIISPKGDWVKTRLSLPNMPSTMPSAAGSTRRRVSPRDKVFRQLEQFVIQRRVVRRWTFFDTVEVTDAAERHAKKALAPFTELAAAWTAAYKDTSVFLDDKSYWSRAHTKLVSWPRKVSDLLRLISDRILGKICVVTPEGGRAALVADFGIRNVLTPRAVTTRKDASALRPVTDNVMGYIALRCGLQIRDASQYSLVCVATGSVDVQRVCGRDEARRTVTEAVKVGLFMVEWMSARPPTQAPDPADKDIFADASALVSRIPGHSEHSKLHPGCLVVVDLNTIDVEMHYRGEFTPFGIFNNVPAHPSMANSDSIYQALGLENKGQEEHYFKVNL